MSKNKKKNKKGFAALRFLFVMTIIGSLSSVALEKGADAKKQADDAMIMRSTKSILLAAQVYSLDEFSKWDYELRIPSDCENVEFHVDDEITALQACKKILSAQDNSEHANLVFKSVSNELMSAMAWLPGAQKYFCINTAGRTSVTKNINDPGCIGDN